MRYCQPTGGPLLSPSVAGHMAWGILGLVLGPLVGGSRTWHGWLHGLGGCLRASDEPAGRQDWVLEWLATWPGGVLGLMLAFWWV